MINFYCYPKCGTCRKAKKWLEDQGVDYHDIHIVEQPPTKGELKAIIEKSELPIKRFFNTSGQKYRELGLKDKLADMTDDEKINLLASDGMLIKRPLTVSEQFVTVGFNEKQFEQTWI
ncbi:Spx/MgsR family RNA polymerase-binding regulatory protein [Amphibacillus cookii]|uniref:Spx/MgsR family RNA polymerase-binding regulatory protein n=1 Tax=Amphibacillus cookii TaxID=767787 RepID=UPI0019568944|nr:arsenate reductase [Amphibacillus cookii]